ncbi:MAG: hypothetical protein UW86_C0009G0013 [Microgenomates group bacterium GW2011_GWA1_Microgenomates_45_10]|nr:MAG: hypothetical protein UW69_C0037G0005 [Microgenomates group bacterium GW2011_GWA2_44_7]KKT77345.1 MAG: hypothetical protein UW73_C0022G0013 [Microgenomates group bacterium GW2011_GWB1_44_8]KKT87110.1 MAG: hypothetical protein UW86_C0009G0013 [Microgenomates group bacterium GW2011_GWA1_Microgenomates_45_10]
MKNSTAFYLVIFLAVFTGIILFIEGLVKVFAGKKIGIVSLLFAILFLATAVIAYSVVAALAK